MKIITAQTDDLEIVYKIIWITIKSIYPGYYLEGAVRFIFMEAQGYVSFLHIKNVFCFLRVLQIFRQASILTWCLRVFQ